MKDESILYWIWLSERCGVASKDFGRLASRYEDPYELYGLTDDEAERVEGISPTLRIRLTDKALESAYSILKYCKQKKIEIVSYADKRYPSRLRNIEDPPVLLYVMGKAEVLESRLCVGMVGTRKMSDYGRSSAYRISYELASAGATVVSGMALGVDGVSAAGALAAGGRTIAVLGCGVSVVYPREHAYLMEAIKSHGAVISEYPPSERPLGYNFPKRNRIISGLCQGVLVVEGSAQSGSLITAKRAIDQGREVFALPGKINESNSEGPNELIKNGAYVALSADDIINHFDFLYHDCINYKGLRKSKSGGMSEDEALKKYKIASVYGRASHISKSAEAVAKSPVPVKSRVTDTAEVTPFSERIAEKALDGLDEISRKVFLSMPLDRAVTPDALPLDGIDIGAIVTAFTILELEGLCESLPGGMYIRK